MQRRTTIERQRRQTGAGFTLAELLVVIAIIALLSALSIPTIGPLLTGRKAAGAAERLRMTLMSTRARAMSEGRRYSVIFNNVDHDTGEVSTDPSDHWYAVVSHEGIDGDGNPTRIDAPGFHVATQADADAATDPDNTLALAAFQVDERITLERHESLFFALSAQDPDGDEWYEIFNAAAETPGAPMWNYDDGSWGYTSTAPADTLFAVTFLPGGEVVFVQPDASPAFPEPPGGEQKIGLWVDALDGGTQDKYVQLNSLPTSGLSINKYTGEIAYDNPRSYEQVE